MTAGRPRKTVRELKLSGTFKKHSEHKAYNEETPMQITDSERAPSRYLRRTQTAWNDFMKVKSFQGVLSIEDRTAITLMFDSLDSYYRTRDQIQNIQKTARPEDYKDRGFLSCLKILTTTQNTFFQQYIQIACRFGVTPTERTRLAIPEKKPDSDFIKLLKKAGADYL